MHIYKIAYDLKKRKQKQAENMEQIEFTKQQEF